MLNLSPGSPCVPGGLPLALPRGAPVLLAISINGGIRRSHGHLCMESHHSTSTKGTAMSEHRQPTQSFYPPQGPPTQTMQSREMFDGQKAAQSSLIFGIIGLFFLGIVFGPLAIVNANKAEKLNIPATGGKILGWIDTIFGIIGIIVFIVVIGGMVAVSQS